jgi:hypothetical protein
VFPLLPIIHHKPTYFTGSVITKVLFRVPKSIEDWVYPLIRCSGLPVSVLALVLIVQVFPLAALSILPTAVVTLEPADGQTKELKVSVRTDVSVR